ncbi:MAG: N-acetyl-gamma-glutamyl-phosphate reductase [Clostridiales bacterium]|nr:N-acetyl-gamma-glutamyl-phosphate reductase [Clostridiales bacterium]
MNVGIMGCSGYAGRQLLNILVMHKKVSLKALSSNTYAGKEAKNIFKLSQYTGQLVIDSDVEFLNKATLCDVIFLALPHKTSMANTRKLLKLNSRLRIIDLSADYRFKDSMVYEKWYDCIHQDKENLDNSCYGLTEMNREKLSDTKIVGNPGCYPTSVLLGLLPILSFENLDLNSIIVDSKSGYTGAGVKPESYKMLAEGIDNVYPYGGTEHRHVGEIENTIEKITQTKAFIQFIPNLIPVKRGIITNIYINMKVKMTYSEVLSQYRTYYAKEKFVIVHDEIPKLSWSVGTNNCHIGLLVDERTNRIIVTTTIDNLIKGASGQAVQNMNVMFGFDEDEGLKYINQNI